MKTPTEIETIFVLQCKENLTQWASNVCMYTPTANQCPDLTNPANGRVIVNGRDYVDTAEYECNHGYILSGARVRRCGLNGIWGGEAPTCIRKYYKRNWECKDFDDLFWQ